METLDPFARTSPSRRDHHLHHPPGDKSVYVGTSSVPDCFKTICKYSNIQDEGPMGQVSHIANFRILTEPTKWIIHHQPLFVESQTESSLRFTAIVSVLHIVSEIMNFAS